MPELCIPGPDWHRRSSDGPQQFSAGTPSLPTPVTPISQLMTVLRFVWHTTFDQPFVVVEAVVLTSKLFDSIWFHSKKCSAPPGGYYSRNLSHNQLATHLGCPIGLSKTAISTSPSTPRQGPLSHCQRRLGWTRTTPGSYSSSIVRVGLVPATEHVTL